MSIIRAILMAPFIIIGIVLSAIYNAVTSVAWLVLLFLIGCAIVGLVKGVL